MGALLFSHEMLSLSEFDAANDSNRSTSSRVFVSLEIDQMGEPLSRLKWAMWCRGGWFRHLAEAPPASVDLSDIPGWSVTPVKAWALARAVLVSRCPRWQARLATPVLTAVVRERQRLTTPVAPAGFSPWDDHIPVQVSTA